MNDDVAPRKLGELRARLGSIADAHATGDIGVAVSGGVDSLTLAAAAHAALGNRVTMYHAQSPAVPADATPSRLMPRMRNGITVV